MSDADHAADDPVERAVVEHFVRTLRTHACPMVILDRLLGLALERLLDQALMLLDQLSDVADADAELDEVNGHFSRNRDEWFPGHWSSNKAEQIPRGGGDVQTSSNHFDRRHGGRLHARPDRPRAGGRWLRSGAIPVRPLYPRDARGRLR